VPDAATFLWSFLKHRYALRFGDRGALERYQRRRIESFLSGVAARSAFYSKRRSLGELPVADKALMLSRFEAFNTAGIELSTARRTALAAERSRDFSPTVGGITVGCSSGTSGQPSLFLANPKERARWAGAVLARCLEPGSLRRILNPFAPPLRIAFFLRADSNLYRTLGHRRIAFRFFDLTRPLVEHLSRLDELKPDVLVAPASVLGDLARRQLAGVIRLAPMQVLSVAETLEDADASSIAQAWRAPQQIYQCTEGVLGFSCPAGRIHLNEECVHFEFHWLDEERRRCTALITDFSRLTQMFIRFGMDDVLLVNPQPCRCGRVSVSLDAIEGRRDEVLYLPGSAGNRVAVFPDQVRRAMLLVADQFEDYRLEQHALDIRVALRARDPQAALFAVRRSLRDLFIGLGAMAPEVQSMEWPAEPVARKRRRIRCLQVPDVCARSA
jgi:putative adenylate-forming enzyme